MQKGMKTEMGSYLMRNTNDESLLVGDLYMGVHGLEGLEQANDLYICVVSVSQLKLNYGIKRNY